MKPRALLLALSLGAGLTFFSASELPRVKIQGSRITQYDRQGNPVFWIRTSTVERNEDTVQFGSPKGQIFAEGGAIEIEAQEGSFQEPSQTVAFKGAVRGDQKDLGIQFSAESIVFFLETREVVSDRAIQIFYGPFSINGKGFSMSLKERRLVVRDEVSGGLAEAN
jgi:LPS export ABC transporter protein LptC